MRFPMPTQSRGHGTKTSFRRSCRVFVTRRRKGNVVPRRLGTTYKKGRRLTNGCQGEEVPQQLRPLDGQEALGVELHPVQRPRLMADAHDLPLVGPGRDLEVRVRPRFALDDE